MLASFFLEGTGDAFVPNGTHFEQIEESLLAAIAKGRAAWPALPVDESAFARHLGGCIPKGSDPVSALPGLNIDDLHLACACLTNVPGAAIAFDRYCRPAVLRYLARVKDSGDLGKEVLQELYVRMLTPVAGKLPGLSGYRGHSQLGHFLGIVAQRMALNLRRSSQARDRLIDRLAAEPIIPPSTPEQKLLRRRYNQPLATALVGAVTRLTPRERVLMRLHLIGGLTTVQIARMYQVNQATVSRWLGRARRRVWADVEGRIGEELGISPESLISLLHSVASQLDLNLGNVLTMDDPPVSSSAPASSVRE